jgi:glycosyltransferase involved in cell wall biosynthesis
MPSPVSACLITKNEIHQLEACLKSLRPYVKEIVVVDTGSTDGTPEVARRYADIFEVFTECNDSEGRIIDFSMARQRSIDLATQPWVLWVDGDDEVVGADKLNELIETYDRERPGNNPILFMFPYEYSHDERGNVTCLHYRERLLRPKEAFKWSSPVHEVFTPKTHSEMVKTDVVRIIHRRQNSGKIIEQNRNLRILQAYYAIHGDEDARQLYYLGLEYANAGDLLTSIEFHTKYVAKSGWDDEKCLACLEIVKHYNNLGNYEKATEWGFKAVSVKEKWAEPYFALGRSFYFIAQKYQQSGQSQEARRNWERSIHFFNQGLSMPSTETILFVNPMERNYDIHRYLNLALSEIGDVSKALESVNAGLRHCPDDAGLKSNQIVYEEFLAKQKIEEALNTLLRIEKLEPDAVSFMREALHRRVIIQKTSGGGDPTSQASIGPSGSSPGIQMGNGPSGLFTDAVDSFKSLNSIATSFIKEVSSSPLDIVFYTGPAVEEWNPITFAQSGIGGSETMAWELSRRLVRLGHKVRLYGDCRNSSGIYEGVEFINYDQYSNIDCDVLISSRQPRAIDNAFNVNAKVRICWMHDVHCGDSLTHPRSLRFDRIFALSDWHKGNILARYPFMHPDQIIITRNGIDLSRYSSPITRNPHRAIYSSSPDRGLQVIVSSMAKIRERVPDAELHVFYGFKTWETSANSMKDYGQLGTINYLKNLMDTNRMHGVHYHDRVNQKDLAIEQMKSGVWAYSTWFTETSCITAMEAHAAGLRIITSPIAALNETVGPRGKMICGQNGEILDWLSSEYSTKFIDSVVEAMLNPNDSDRASLVEYAKSHFGLDELAKEWDHILHRVIDEVQRDLVLPYKAAI